MNLLVCTVLIVVFFSVLGFFLCKRRVLSRALALSQSPRSLLKFYGCVGSLWTFVAGMTALVIALGAGLSLTILPVVAGGVAFCAACVSVVVLSPSFHARLHLERLVNLLLMFSAVIAVLIAVSIFVILLVESGHFFSVVPAGEFFLGTIWSPPGGAVSGSDVAAGHYGVLPLLGGTLLVTFIAMVVAVPSGLLIAVYTSEYAASASRRILKPLIEMLAGVPTIIYGFFALIVVAPLLVRLGHILGLKIAAESALGAGLVMGLMIIPFISSLADDALSSVPRSLRENSWALGATLSETILKVVIPAAFPGIASAVLLAFSRAVGETMLVVMAAGLTAHLTVNPLSPVTTITVQIVALLTGDQEFNSPKTLSAFALGLLLFIFTLVLNIIALRIMRWHREKYGL